MAVGAYSKLDKKLATMYSEKQTVNLEYRKTIDPQVFWDNLSMIAVNNKALMSVNKI